MELTTFIPIFSVLVVILLGILVFAFKRLERKFEADTKKLKETTDTFIEVSGLIAQHIKRDYLESKKR